MIWQKRQAQVVLLLSSTLLFERTLAFQTGQTTQFRGPGSASFASPSPSSSSSLQASFSNDNEPPTYTKKSPKRGDLEKLSAAAIAEYDLESSSSITYDLEGFVQRGGSAGVGSADPIPWDKLVDGIRPVLAASLLITGNTIGAACLVMPEICAGPGLALSTVTMVACFVTNLVSGLIIAEVAIKQYETSRTQSPSSFKELAEVNLNSRLAGNGVTAVALFTNICVTTFDLDRMGDVLATALTSLTPDLPTLPFLNDPSVLCATAYATLLALASSALTPKQLGGIAGTACAGLFLTLTAVLLPGLASVPDPAAVFWAAGTAGDAAGAAGAAAPVVLSAMVFQNIVPSVTKRLGYERGRTTAALALGSFLPGVIYFVYSYVVLGGGGVAGGAGGGLLMTAFSVTTIVGSSIACVMSMSEELENFFKSSGGKGKDEALTSGVVGVVPEMSLSIEPSTAVAEIDDRAEEETPAEERFSIPTVLFAVGVPLSIGIAFSSGDDLTVALRIAGSYGSPLLYGALPVAMAWNQRQKLSGLKNMLPGGPVSLGGLAALTAVYMAEELVKDVSGLFG